MLILLVITIFLIGCTGESEQEIEVVDEEGNLVGEAFSYKGGKIKIPASALNYKAPLNPKFDANGIGAVEKGFTCDSGCLKKGNSGCVFRIVYADNYENIENIVDCSLPTSKANVLTKCVCIE